MSAQRLLMYCLVVAGLWAAGCQQQTTTTATEGAADREAGRVEIPAGTHFWVSLDRTLDSAKVKSGDVVKGTLKTAVVAGGREVLPVGTDIDIRVTAAEVAQQAGSVGRLTLEVDTLRHGGSEYSIRAAPVTLETAPVQQDVDPGRQLPNLPLTEQQGRANAVLGKEHTLVIAITEPVFVKP